MTRAPVCARCGKGVAEGRRLIRVGVEWLCSICANKPRRRRRAILSLAIWQK